MLSNYLKVAWRSIVRHKGYSFINIAGLAVGMTACLLIYLLVRQELNFDRFHERADRIFRVAMEVTTPENSSRSAETQFPLVHVLRTDYPEIERATRIFFPGSGLIEANGRSFTGEKAVFSDADFFRIFTFPVVRGQARDLLTDPHSVVLSETAARKYFGDTNAVGRTIRFEKRFLFQVTAVIRDVPLLSHFHFDIAAPFAALDKEYFGFEPDRQWGGIMDNFTYCLLTRPSQAAGLERKLKDVIARHARRKSEVKWLPYLQPLLRLHLHSHLDDEIEPPGHPVILVTLSVIGAFILLIAAVNFINLSTARSIRRNREVGLRKVIGAHQDQLVRQFLSETLLTTTAAMFLSVGITALVLPRFSLLVERQVGVVPGELHLLVGFTAGLTFLISLLAGLYPAVSLAKRSPVGAFKALPAGAGRNPGALGMRRGLVTFQFFVSIALIVGTLVVQKQLHFFTDSDLGFDREAVINIPITENSLKSRTESLKAELLKLMGVKGATACLRAPIGSNVMETGIYTSESDKDRIDVNMNFIDTDYVKEFGLRLVAGRNLQAIPSPDQELEFLLNETAVRHLGYSRPEEVLGKRLREGVYGRRKGTVVGVVADFHAVSLQQEIPALVMVYWPFFNANLAVKLRGGQIPETLAAIENVWRSFSDYPFEYTFLDDDIRGFYQGEQRILRIGTTFAGVAIILACLGLLGLSSFAAQQRTKEIGVRKVLGASVGNVIGLLSKEFTSCILAANLLAWPLAYAAMNRWLESFAYRTSIDAGTFLLAGLLTFIFAALTVGYQTIRAARANPVESLRYE